MSSTPQHSTLDVDEIAKQAKKITDRIAGNIGRVLIGQDRSIRLLLAAFVAGGHALLEDVPGSGKTTLAKAFAKSIRADYSRVQFTPDLLPSDILGSSIYDRDSKSFHFVKGPIFTNILLADEINRASPRTQSALLEAMAEGQVSIEGRVMPLDPTFMVAATQNPFDFHGAYPLPESQLDRFAVCFGLGYIDASGEAAMLEAQRRGDLVASLEPAADLADAALLRAARAEVRTSAEMRDYITAVSRATRGAPGVRIGASPRATLTLFMVSQALCLIDGRPFVDPDVVREAAPYVLSHRLTLESRTPSAEAARQVVESVLDQIPVPA